MPGQPEPKLYFQGQSIWLKISLFLFLQLAGAHPIAPIFDYPLREATSNQEIFSERINPPSIVSYSIPVNFHKFDNLKDYFISDDLPNMATQTSTSWKIKRLGLGGSPLKKKPENMEIPTQSDNANSLKYRGTIADLEEALINLHHIPPPPPVTPSNPPAAVK